MNFPYNIFAQDGAFFIGARSILKGGNHMSLAKCPKCKAEISGKSQVCETCGFPLEHNSLSSSDLPEQEYSDCGIEKINDKSKKKWNTPLASLTICLIAAIVLVLCLAGKEDNDLYNNIAWGTNYENVKKLVKENSSEEITADDEKKIVIASIENYKNDQGVTASELYNCERDGTLHKVFIMIRNEHSVYTDDRLLDKYERELSELYGKAEDISYGLKWTASKSRISLMLLSEGTIVLEYVDINEEETTVR